MTFVPKGNSPPRTHHNALNSCFCSKHPSFGIEMGFCFLTQHAQEKPRLTLRSNRSTLSPRPFPPTSKRRGHPRCHPSDILRPLLPPRSRRGPTRAPYHLDSMLRTRRTGNRMLQRQRGFFVTMTPAVPTKMDTAKQKLSGSFI